MKLVCIGTGAMGSAIFKSICKKYNPDDITVTNKTVKKARLFAEENRCHFCESNKDAVVGADFVFLAVKPQNLEDVFSEINESLTQTQVVVSMAAGVSLEKLQTFSPKARFVRIMPNVGAQIGQGMTAFCCANTISDSEKDLLKDILSSTGFVEEIPEKLMNCVTAVSGSSPAFVFMFIEAIADAAVRCGMSRTQSYIFASQTVKGAASLVLETEKHPAVLKDSVCSPSGTTIEGVAALEANGFRSAVIDAITQAYKKSMSL